jgi:hypothetical protein
MCISCYTLPTEQKSWAGIGSPRNGQKEKIESTNKRSVTLSL